MVCSLCDQLLDTGDPELASVRIDSRRCLDSTLLELADKHPLHICTLCAAFKWNESKAVGVAHWLWRLMAGKPRDVDIAACLI